MAALVQFLSRLTPAGRRLLLIGLAILTIATVTPVYLASSRSTAVGSTPSGPLSILASRSPGVRLLGKLVKVKKRLSQPVRRHHAPQVALPQERVLSVVRSRPVSVLGVPQFAMPTIEVGSPGLAETFVPPFANAIGPAFDVPGFAFGDVPVSPAGAPLPETPQEPAPPVPEPATWLMMIVGLGMIGLVLRRPRELVGMGA